jgi:hypothetical protein
MSVVVLLTVRKSAVAIAIRNKEGCARMTQAKQKTMASQETLPDGRDFFMGFIFGTLFGVLIAFECILLSAWGFLK